MDRVNFLSRVHVLTQTAPVDLNVMGAIGVATRMSES
jgi:hypothetical protein